MGNNNYLGEKLLGVKTQELFYLDPPGRAAIFSLNLVVFSRAGEGSVASTEGIFTLKLGFRG